jgi:hypothetical protein
MSIARTATDNHVGLINIMPLKAVLIVGFLLGALSFGQEVRQIDLTGALENRDLQPISSGKYMIWRTNDAKSARKAVRVSVESLTPTDIHPEEQISVVLRVENYGHLPVVLPVGPRNTNLQVETGSIGYTAMLPLIAGVPGGGTMLGWLELYGSTLKSNTTVSLNPGEWITVRGDIRVRRVFAAESVANASSELQLYEMVVWQVEWVGRRVRQAGWRSVDFRSIRVPEELPLTRATTPCRPAMRA